MCSRTRASATRCDGGSIFSPAGRTCSTRNIRRSPATTRRDWVCSPGSGWRIGDHRREFAFGRNFAVEHRPAGELAHARPLLDELHLEPEQDPWHDRLAELHGVDGHEIDELARAPEGKGFDREPARGLGPGPAL